MLGSVIIGVLTKFERDVSLFVVLAVGSLVHHEVQHVLLSGFSAVIQLVLDVQVVVCNPHVGYIDAVIADAVGLFGRHEIDVFVRIFSTWLIGHCSRIRLPSRPAG